MHAACNHCGAMLSVHSAVGGIIPAEIPPSSLPSFHVNEEAGEECRWWSSISTREDFSPFLPHPYPVSPFTVPRLPPPSPPSPQVNEDASDAVLAVEQQFNERRRPVYEERARLIETVPEFWSTVVSSDEPCFDPV